MALLMRPEPFSREVDRLFDAFFGDREQGRRWVPPVDLVEADDHYVLKADLPGLSEEDVSIEVQDGTLTISGERKAEHETHERGWYRIERSFGSFSRSLTLPEGVDPEAISAKFDSGVLEIRIPKPAERKPRRVEIAAGGHDGNGGAPAVEGTATESEPK
jgi:HSP20 family protein